MSTKKKPAYRPNYPISVVIDASKGQKEIAEENAIVAKEEEAQRLKTMKENAERQKAVEAENTGAFAYSKAVKGRNYDPAKLNEYRTGKSHQELQEIYAEFVNLAQKRGLPLDSQDIDYGRTFLERLLDKPQPQAEPQKPSRPWLFLR